MNQPPSNDDRPSKLGDAYDASVRSLEGQQDALKTKPTTIPVVHPILGTAQSYTVQSYRTEYRTEKGEERQGDTVLIAYHDAAGAFRIVLPPKVTDAIARQRAALTSKSRKRGAEKATRTREELGIEPGFLRKRGAK